MVKIKKLYALIMAVLVVLCLCQPVAFAKKYGLILYYYLNHIRLNNLSCHKIF